MTRYFKTPSQLIQIYDWDGNCIEEQVLDITTGEVKDLLISDNYLYLLAPEEDCANVLYQIDMTIWEAKRLYAFTEFESVYDMVLLQDTMYVLGVYANAKEKEFLYYEDWYEWSNGKNNVVAYLNVKEETPELAFVPFDLPMYILAVGEDTLGIWGNEDKYEYRLLTYSPEENTFQGISAVYSTGEDVRRRPFQYSEDGIFMVRGLKNIGYVSKDGTDHVLLHTESVFYVKGSVFDNRKVIYAKGWLFYQNKDNSDIIERVNIEDKLKEIQAE